MDKYELDTEEQQLLNAFEAGEFKSDMSVSRRKFIEKSAACCRRSDCGKIQFPSKILTHKY